MATYAVVLVVTADPIDGDPYHWKWEEVLELPTSVVRSVQLDDDPTESQVASLHSASFGLEVIA